VFTTSKLHSLASFLCVICIERRFLLRPQIAKFPPNALAKRNIDKLDSVRLNSRKYKLSQIKNVTDGGVL
jgi:hypothetical protein